MPTRPLSRRHLLSTGLTFPLLAPPLGAALAQPEGGRCDRLLVLKWERRLLLLRGDEVLHAFRVALGRQPRGPKVREGDGRTPEGIYHVNAFKADSAFYRALHISYPNDEDRRRAAALGVRPGGLIMIHGLDPAIGRKWRNDHWMFNWTRGCVAVTNQEMDIVWDSVDLGTPVEIRP